MATIINASTSAGLVQTADTSGIINLQSNGSTIVAVTSTGAAVTGTLSASGVLTATGGIVVGAAAAPAFFASPSSVQAITANTDTKVALQSELFDTNSNFASSRFTPTVSGYYQVNGTVMMTTTTTSTFVYGLIFKNGSEYARFSSTFAASANYPSSSGSTLVYLNGSTDYIELYVYCNASIDIYSSQTNFNAALVRSA